ncbi:hypothetical protein QYM36_013312 [Artemia franciscana]|uniref:Reverse transcriptase RNase H-like domain-containing protein n=1 Tax=Artemia franciscana TaxID=6661 RepID=A0AA88HRG7_ARTSF|nr:hypothetical protein QYM36_013312 [Artemia franciscana]
MGSSLYERVFESDQIAQHASTIAKENRKRRAKPKLQSASDRGRHATYTGWEQQHITSFTNIKESIYSSLAFFDPTAGNVELQVDASKFGLGTTISRNGKPISFASRSLNSTDQNYSQIDKELSAILFGCVHFHQYHYGQKFTVVSDHKPLQVVVYRPLSKSSSILQRMLLRIQPYDLIIAFCPGKAIPVADALSRLSLPEELKPL